MNNSSTEIEQWLVEGTIDVEQSLNRDVWVADFDVDRQVVFSKFGPYNRLFLRPEKFVRRFYHTVYPLLIEDWFIQEQTQLFDEFCTIDVQLDIRFQASFTYAQSQQEILSELNEHIKNTYYSIIMDLVNNELLSLQNDAWVREGLGDIEKAIVNAVNEMLILEEIQSQVSCIVKASFAEFPKLQLGKEGIQLSVYKKSYEVTEQSREELFRQQQLEKQQQLLHKQKQLIDFEKDAELERVQSAQQEEHQKRLLHDQKQQQQEKFEIQISMHEDKVQYESRLKAISLQAELQQKQHQAEDIRKAEQQSKTKELMHFSLLKEQEIQAEVERYEQKQEKWLEAKAKRNELQRQHEHEQAQIKLVMKAENKQRQEEQRMEEQEKNYKMTKNSDIYLRREIELLELDKKRLALQLEVQLSKKKGE